MTSKTGRDYRYVLYNQVTSTDTLASIAAQFDTTTSVLKKSNRLMSDMVIPGKVILSDFQFFIAVTVIAAVGVMLPGYPNSILSLLSSLGLILAQTTRKLFSPI